MMPLVTVYGGPVAQWTAPEPAHPAGPVVTHEAYIAGIVGAVLAQYPPSRATEKLRAAKVVYGVGSARGARGLTYFDAWANGTSHDVIEICAMGEESDTQLAGTTVHELAHVLAGHKAGHGSEWKSCAAALGLVDAEAAGHAYSQASFDPALWARIARLPLPTDGKPVLRGNGHAITLARPCPLGVGTRGGTSRGKGSGSRLRLFECSCTPPVKARVARDEFRAMCTDCGSAFTRKGDK